jgi:hypothetical protein
MKRREFIAGIGGAATPFLWPFAARAQQPQKPHRSAFVHSGIAAKPCRYCDSGAAHDFRRGLHGPASDKRSAGRAKGELNSPFEVALYCFLVE